ncbi:SAM-dependent methyltransferase [Leucothrix pacifica]|uniref:SAM-dependent methyltransferase n=1 Tax=Leucothrix pacifica TaxID=1247513 RepID=A0A317C407_9GAMM|nr:cyclopropane-fatty-acyl-phospholipid synthase family protein [Leucothrix pacifica]PWQ93318.1 SAM-dependent methyltransferase [Leucothrix pacifica]
MESSQVSIATNEKTTWWQSTAKNVLFKLLAKMQDGYLTIQEKDQTHHFGQAGSALSAHVVVHDTSVYAKMLTGGTIAAGECYFNGLWDSPDVTAVIRVMVRNSEMMDTLDHRFSALSQIAQRIFHSANRNSQTGSKKNIVAHYDLGNDFYRLFLDETMMYSSGVYNTPETTLHEAQLQKLDDICQRLQLKAGEEVVEIGTGWGGFAIYAAKHYGVHVTTTTISEEQYAYAKAEIEKQGLESQITLLKDDYRNLAGQYDKLVSIEMIEAVGHSFLPTFFQTCNSLLKPTGKMLIQAITIADQRYDRYRKQTDFIQRYIFPGGFLPSVEVMNKQIAKNTDLKVVGLTDIGLDYAATLKHWSERLKAVRGELSGLGLDQQFYRMWQFYFHYCEGGFRERLISTVHLVAEKPRYEDANHAAILNH